MDAAQKKKVAVSDWMYHAPGRGSKEAVGAPPPSQIPCLHGNEDLPPPDMPPKMLIKESDSAYIRLAKKGGRDDLLRMRSPGPRADGPVGYPRVDWYYQDDIQDEDQKENDEKYEFLLPDYMVHPESKKNAEDIEYYRPERLPYAQDKLSVYERGGNPTDKTVRLAEEKSSGFGVRQGKSATSKKPVQAPVQRTQICKPPSPQVGISSTKYKPVPVQNEKDVSMGKLLSYGYLDDWQKDRDDWTEKQNAYMAAQADNSKNKGDKLSTEYREQMMGKSNATKSAKSQGPRTNGAQPPVTSKAKKTQEEERPELFKLSKFKNVPAKTSSKRV